MPCARATRCGSPKRWYKQRFPLPLWERARVRGCMVIICLLISLYGDSLRGSDFCRGGFSREVKSGDSLHGQGIKEIQAVYASQLSRLPKRKPFFTQVMDGSYQTDFLGELSGLFAESEEEIVRDVYKN